MGVAVSRVQLGQLTHLLLLTIQQEVTESVTIERYLIT